MYFMGYFVWYFGAKKKVIEVTREGANGGTYFSYIHSGIDRRWYKKSWKEFDQLKNIDQKFYCSNYYDVTVNKDGFKCGTLLRLWDNKGQINKIDPYGWFHWYFRYSLGRKCEDDERQINRSKKV